MSKPVEFLDLPWTDVIVAKILPEVSTEDCFSLRQVSKSCMEIVDMFFHEAKILKVNPKTLTRDDFAVLIEKCRNVTCLMLTGCLIADDDLIPLLTNNSATLMGLHMNSTMKVTARCLQPSVLLQLHLTSIRLARCMWLTPAVLEALATHQYNLQEMDLSYCATISEEYLIMFLKNFKKLMQLNLEGNKQVRDECLIVISNYNPAMRALSVTGCSQITDKGIKSLVKLTKLHRLFIQQCDKVTEDSLKLLRKNTRIDRIPMDSWVKSVLTVRGWISSPSGGLIMYDSKKKSYHQCEAKRRGPGFVTLPTGQLFHGGNPRLDPNKDYNLKLNAVKK